MAQARRRSQGSFADFAAAYIDAEQNTVTGKAHAPLRIALVYPNSYDVGMSNLGYQSLYYLCNERADVLCERAFYYAPAFRGEVRTLESGRPLREFDIIAFSISFELDYIRIIEILHGAGLAPLRESRGRFDPLLLAGGAAVTINPAPMLPVMDALFIGEAEEIIDELLEVFRRAGELDGGRASRLEKLGDVAGVLVPATLQTRARDPAAARQYVAEIDRFPTFSRVVTPKSHYKNTFLIEVGRGCARGCSFCAAGFLYRPLRLRSPEKILTAVRENAFAAKKVGLMGAALSDFAQIEEVCAALAGEGYQLGLSSFRIDTLSESLLASLSAAGVRTVSVAPEAGSEALRKKIRKNISDQQVLDSLRLLAVSGISQLRLYFLIGLPGEKEDDIDAIVRLVREASEVFIGVKKRRTIRVSINTMIPKPWTAFQWAVMADPGEIKAKRARLRDSLKRLRGVTLAPKSTREEQLQGIFSLGGETVGHALVHKVVGNKTWQHAWEKAGVEVRSILRAEKRPAQALPWDIVDAGINRGGLWRLWEDFLNKK